MPISLTSGLPGAGKTLYTLWHVRQFQAREREAGRDRPVYTNINGLSESLGWLPLEFDHQLDALPEGAIVVIDECQRWFPAGGQKREVSANERFAETHRHKGQDWFLVTQDPRNFSAHVRRLVETHRHLLRLWGKEKAKIYEWPECNENPQKGRDVSRAQVSVWKYPRDVYELYHSSTIHTVQPRFPWRQFVVPVALIVGCFGALGWWGYGQVADAEAKGASVAVSGEAVPASMPARQPGALQGRGDMPASPEDAARMLVPMVPGVPGTAPLYWAAYSNIEDYPRVVGCVITANQSRCRCYTQQGTRTYVPPAACEQYAHVLPFDHSRPRPERAEASAVMGAERPDAQASADGYGSARAVLPLVASPPPIQWSENTVQN